MSRRLGLPVVALLMGCGPRNPDLAPPALRDRFSHYLSERVVTGDPLPICPTPNVDPGELAVPRLRRFRLTLRLPVEFGPGPRELPIDSLSGVWSPYRWGGQEWLEGLYLEPAWYRWVRATGRVSGGADAPATVIQLTGRRGYPPFLALPPWSIGPADECHLPLPDRAARVVRFALRHPTLPPQWGVVAYWRGRPDDGFVALIGIGPDPTVQGELLTIILRHSP